MMLEKMLDRLPNSKGKPGIRKIIQLAADQLAAGEKTLQTISDWRDIDQAEGKPLDKIGKDVGQPREGLNDEQYRQIIKIKIRANLSGGEIDTLNSICLVLIGNRYQGMREGWTLPEDHPIGPKSAMMLFTVKADGINYGIPMAQINNIRAGGVADNWELILESLVDIGQTNYESWEAPYKMTNQVKTETEQQQGPNIYTGVEIESRYSTATHHLRMSGEQQGTIEIFPKIEAVTQYQKGLHSLLMTGISRVGEGAIL